MKKIVVTFLTALLLICCGGSESFSLETENDALVIVGKGLMLYYADDSNSANFRLNQMSFDDAEKFCQNLDYAGFSDWRLPTIDELRKVVIGYSDVESGGRCAVSSKCLQKTCVIKGQKNGNDTPCSNSSNEMMQGPGINGCYFDDVWGNYCGKYWSSSLVSAAEGLAFQLDFSVPAIIPSNTTAASNGFARCVRKL